MNGLKYIRVRCNYSQRALADAFGVSRQAINMWENGKKPLSEDRKEELCSFFGIDNSDVFDELTQELYETLQRLPVYKIENTGDSDRFSFKCSNAAAITYQTKVLSPLTEEALSLDERCTLKRTEFKNILSEFNEYTVEDEKKNTFNNLNGMNRALGVLTPTLELLKESRNKHPEYAMIYYRTFLSVLDALSISYGILDKEDLKNQKMNPYLKAEWYDYRNFSLELSDIITKHLDEICVQIPTKRENPVQNFRRRKNKK